MPDTGEKPGRHLVESADRRLIRCRRRASKLTRFLIRRHRVRPGDRIGLLFDEAADSDTTLNMASVLQCHSLEDGTFESDHITGASGCTLSTHAFVYYQVTMDAGSLLEADPFAMEGSHIPAGNNGSATPRPRSRISR